MSNPVQERIRSLVQKNPIVIFMKGNPQIPMCGFSAAAVAVLNQYGVRYESVDVLEDAEIREGIKTFSNWPTIPQLYVGGKFLGGSDIVREMHARGDLAPLVRAAAAAADPANP